MTRRRPGLREPASSHGAPIALILVVSILLGLASAWWADKLNSAGRFGGTAATTVEQPRSAAPNEASLQASGASGDGSDSTAGTTAVVGETSVSEEIVTAKKDRTAPVVAEDEETPKAPIDRSELAAKTEAKPARDSANKKSTKSGGSRLAGSAQKERIKEIDRVRTQAFTEKPETRKSGKDDTSQGSALRFPQSSKNKNRLSETQRTLVALKRCARRDSWIDREKCKWKLCGDRWGENGCPFGRREVAVY